MTTGISKKFRKTGGAIGEAYKNAGQNLAILPANVLDTGANIANTSLKTASGLFDITGKTALNITDKSGQALGKGLDIGLTGLDATNVIVDKSGKIVGTGLDATNVILDKSGQAVGKGLDVANTGLDATNKIVRVTGNIGESALGTLESTVKTVEHLSDRVEDYANEAAKQAHDENVTATLKNKNANEAQRAKNDAELQIKLQKIDNNLEKEKQKIEADQKRILNELTANQKLAYLESDDNIRKQNLARYYGFTKKKPTSNDIGSTTNWLGLSDWCSSYIPQKFVTVDNNVKNVIDIIFPEELLEGPRPHYISAINRKTGQPIQITFETIIEDRWYGDKEKEVTIIKYKDEQNNDVEKQGKIKYHEIGFLCLNKGGRRRNKRTNKRKNKNSKNRKTNKSRRTRRTRRTRRRTNNF